MLKLIYQPLVVGIITLTTVILCISLYISSVQLRGSSQKVASLRADVAKQQALTDALGQKLQTAQNSTTQEEIIRDQLLMQKPGEFVVQTPDLPRVSPEVTPPPPSPTPWQEWKKLLF